MSSPMLQRVSRNIFKIKAKFAVKLLLAAAIKLILIAAIVFAIYSWAIKSDTEDKSTIRGAAGPLIASAELKSH